MKIMRKKNGELLVFLGMFWQIYLKTRWNDLSKSWDKVWEYWKQKLMCRKNLIFVSQSGIIYRKLLFIKLCPCHCLTMNKILSLWVTYISIYYYYFLLFYVFFCIVSITSYKMLDLRLKETRNIWCPLVACRIRNYGLKNGVFWCSLENSVSNAKTSIELWL